MPRALSALLVVSLTGLALAACSGPTVPLTIGFPSDEAFLVTTTIDLQVVPVDAANLGRCPTLLGSAIQGTDVGPSSQSLGLVPCDVRGGIVLPDPGSGPHAYIALGRATNGVILAGCSVGDAYPGGPPIVVDLYPTVTANYDAAVTAAHLAPGSTAAQRCNAGGTP